MFYVKKEAFGHAVRHCTKEYPNEACGFWEGSTEQSAYIIHRFHPITNISHDPRNRFFMNPSDMIETFYSIRKKGRQIAGVVHSHSKGDPFLSQADMELFQHRWPSCWIISLACPHGPVWSAYYCDEQDMKIKPLNFKIL